MNEAVVLRRWRVAAIALLLVVLVLSFFVFRGCATASLFPDATSSSTPTLGPSASAGGPEQTPSPTPTPSDDASGSGDGSGSGTGAGGTGGGAGGGGNGSGSGTGNGHGGTLAAFVVSGNAPGALEPGLESSIDLRFTNPNARAIRVTGVTATLTGLTAPNATGSLPCTLGDFTLSQLSGSPAIVIPGNSSRTLTQLGVPEAQWPEFGMTNTSLNQDGCKGAVLSIHYTASGRGA